MRILPILFSGPMVRAILDDRKTQTRRVADVPSGTREVYQNEFGDWMAVWGKSIILNGTMVFGDGETQLKPKYKPGDILWVRETWGCYTELWECADRFYYRADFEKDASGYWYEPEKVNWCDFPKWRPSIFMPKAAARLFLRVTDVRVERLQDMRHDEALKEGIRAFTDPQNGIIGFCWAEGVLNSYDMPKNPTRAFEMLWNGINAKRAYGWDTNPWVWVTSFERCARPEGWPGKENARGADRQLWQDRARHPYAGRHQGDHHQRRCHKQGRLHQHQV